MKNSNFVFLTLFFYNFSYSQPSVCVTSPMFSDTVFHTPVLMNEILPEGQFGESWVEFYNCRSTDIDLSGWFLTDDPMDSLKYRVPDSTKIFLGEFEVLSLPFHLSRSFGLLQLWRPDSTLAYGMTFDGVEIGESVGFCGNYILRQIPSLGEENTCQAFTGVEEVSLNSNEKVISIFNLLGMRMPLVEKIDNLPFGMYIILIEKNGQKITKKVLVK